MDLDRVFERIDSLREEVIQIQRELVRRPALSPKNGGTGEHEKIDYIRHLLERLHPKRLIQIDAPDPRAKAQSRPNLMAFYGDSQNKYVVLAHADIVPPGDLTLWESDPFELKVDGDKLIGRGVEDNNHGFVSPYIALMAMHELGIKPNREVCLSVVADEETGSNYGLRYLLENHLELFSQEDLIVVPDGGDQDGTMIEVAEKSMLWLRIEVKGIQCHASTPHKGKNALDAAAHLICALKEVKACFLKEDPLFSPPITTIEPTSILRNVPNVNTIPGLQVFYVDSRVLPSEKTEDVIAEIQRVAQRIEREMGVQIKIEPVLNQKAAPPTDPNSPVVEALKRAIGHVLKRQGVPKGIGGGTVAQFFRQKGLPAAVWMTSEDTAHQPNEWCRISTILQDAKVFAYLFLMEK